MELTKRLPDHRTAMEETAAHEKLVSEWFDLYATDILRLCSLYLGNSTDAEDALQETFVKAWRKLGSFENKNEWSVKAWLLQIAVNTCRDMLRRPWYKRISHAVSADELWGLQEAPDHDRDLLMDITSLPEKLKQVILLYYYQRLTTKEISKIMKVNESTISRWLDKGRSLLKRGMEEL